MSAFLDRLRSSVLLADGATGTELFERGNSLDRCCERYTYSNPRLIEDIHRSYFHAGADFVTTNTIGANQMKLAQVGLGDSAYALNLDAAQLARSVCPEGKFVVGSIGPLGKIVGLEIDGAVTVESAVAVFEEQADALKEGGVDAICIETMQHLPEIEAALTATKTTGLPVILSAVFEVSEQGINNQWGLNLPLLVQTAERYKVDVVGTNCVELLWAIAIAQELRKLTRLPIIVQPNAGPPTYTPNGTVYKVDETVLEAGVDSLLEIGVNIIGGCCSTTPDDIAKMRPLIDRFNKNHQ